MEKPHIALLETVAPRRPVLITGESGTGKLLAARMIHAASRRSNAPLIAVDCRELSVRDANRLLFGTGNASDAELSAERFGALHLAHGGSLVLRGIEVLDADTQRELAHHFAAEREVETRPFPDVRIVATVDTNVCVPGFSCLEDELREQFGTIIEIPTLAERPRDIVPFALTIFFLSLVLILIQKGGVLADPRWLTLSCWSSLLAATLVSPVLSPMIQSRGRSTALAAAAACALLVLGWGPLMAYQMGHILFFESLVVVAQPGTWWARWPGPAITTMSLIRVAWVVFASVLSATIPWNANGHARKSGVEIRISGWIVLIVLCTIYTFGMLWLVA